MTVDELIARATAQAGVEVDRVVSVHGPTLAAAIRSRPYMTIAELQAHPDQHKELRRFRYGHVLGKGLPPDAIARWQASFPRHGLPSDLIDALELVNGIHLWADLATGRAYFGIAPLREWQDAAHVAWTAAFRVPPEASLVLSYHDNGDYYLVLDTLTGSYAWLDLEDIDNPLAVGHSFSETVTWFWEHAQQLAPDGGRAA